MQQENYAKFPESTNCSKYNPSIVCEMSKHHFRLLNNIPIFPSCIKKSTK